ncbi:amino acid adenylation domain-containing protein [Chitinophaga sp. G-6-1-13]|uniref:Amino acid adenylation domain-containing protein n=1 Tax=Chitinophaga fulva TaxID=2728842 RepID=A0A848GJ13_9BACT|nr:non-ribosomal peptide synthetase [Chitinophaga fulva]NML37857.1 amino acid adenylation domain-containing protein [Chitinophaga fulva]
MHRSVLNIIATLGKKNISVKAQAGQLKVTGNLAALEDGEKEQLRLFKQQILELLDDDSTAGDGHFRHIPPAPESYAYPLSSSQKRLWVLGQSPETNVAYNIPAVLSFSGHLDVALLSACFETIIRRHEILRTTFREDDTGTVKQFILSPEAAQLHVGYEDCREALRPADKVDEVIMQQFAAPFDFSAWPLIRTGVCHQEDDRWIFYCVLPHIIGDAWSMRVLIAEMAQLYQCLAAGETPQWPPLPVQYKDYAWWQQQQLNEGALLVSKKYWQSRMEGVLPLLELPANRPRPAVRSYQGHAVHLLLGNTLTGQLKSFADDGGSTLFMGLLSGVAALLARYTAQQDMIIGTPAAGRNHVDLEKQIGCYINTLPLRVRIDGHDSFRSLLEKVRDITLGAFEHQQYPLDALLEDLQVAREAGRNPLFDVMMVLQNNETLQSQNTSLANGLEVGSYEGETFAVSKLDLTFYFHESPDGIALKLEYNTDIFDREFIQQLATHFTTLLANLLVRPDTPLAEVPYLPEEEKQRLASFNNTEAWFPSEKTITSLFEEQARLLPDATALVATDTTLSFGVLNEKANRLSHYLQSRYAVGPGDIVAVRLQSSEWMIISLLAVLKARAAYLPVDPAFPAERVDYLVADSNCRLVITDDVLAAFSREEKDHSPENTTSGNPDDLVYVIYTSGSTGHPKGCMLQHRAVVNRIYWMWKHYAFSSEDIILQKTTFTFDVSVWEIFMPLCFGARLVLCPREDAGSPEKIVALIEKNRVTCLHFVPPMMNAFIGQLHHQEQVPGRLSSLRMVVTSGEALQPATAHNWYALLNVPVHNLYGPTEAAVDVTFYPVSSNDQVIPIGRPIWNTEMYVLDNHQALLPVGVYGELYIGGTGLAKGYLNKEQLTAEKFIVHPFKKGERLYRTGDIGRWLPTGDIEFSGRADDQVKIRGYRIETGEISHAVQSYPGVTAALVKAWKRTPGDENELVAYLSGNNIQIGALRAFLETKLPAYMVPHHFVVLPALPLTSNGKVDRKALPAPDTLKSPDNGCFQAARNDVEVHLVAVYGDVLKKHPISINDDFFLLGGDSIKSIQIVSRMKQRGYVLTIQDVMRYPSIAELSTHVSIQEREAEQGLVTGIVRLGAVQQWLLQSGGEHPHHFNQSVLLESRERLITGVLETVLTKIFLHHDALRLVFHHTETGWIQESKGEELKAHVEEITWDSEAAFALHCERLQAAADLDRGPLFRAALFHGPTGDRLLLIAHHLVIDAVSWRILLEDLSDLYAQCLAGEPLTLPQKTDSFAYWQQQLQQHLRDGKLKAQEAYWQDIDNASPERLPMDSPEGQNLIGTTAAHAFTLNEENTTWLLTRTHQVYRTNMNDVLLAALSLAMHEVMGVATVAVELEGHGREDSWGDMDVSRTVGWFTTMYPVILRTDHAADPLYHLVTVKENLHRVPDKGIGYGLLRYAGHHDFQMKPLIRFNYLGDFGDGRNNSEDRFSMSGVAHGADVYNGRTRDIILEITGMTANGRLQLSVEYSAQQYHQETITRLMDAYRKQLEVLVGLLSATTENRLTPVDLTCRDLGIDQVMQLGKKIPLEDVYPLSPLQEGLYFHWVSNPSSPMYFEQVSYRLKGKLEPALLEQSYYMLVARHAVLRTHFSQRFGQRMLQVVARTVSEGFTCEKVDSNVQHYVEQRKRNDRAQGFDLNSGSQMRLTVLEVDNDVWEFIWSHHHIIMDGWCIGILVKEFFHLYDSLLEGTAPMLGPVQPYSAYIQWLETIDRGDMLHYWRNYLAGYDAAGTLPRKPVVSRKQTIIKRYTFTVEETLRQQITTFCATLRITENIFVQAVWGILLSCYTASQDAVFGAVVSGRAGHLDGIEDMVGFFINTIPVRIRYDTLLTSQSLLLKIKEDLVNGENYHYAQLVDIQEGRGGQLFDTILVFENYPVQKIMKQDPKRKAVWESLSFASSGGYEQTSFDMVVVVSPGAALTVDFCYNAGTYDESLIERLRQQWMHITRSILESPDKPVGSINFLKDVPGDAKLETDFSASISNDF